MSCRGQHVHPFCNRIKSVGLQTECTDERDAVALCNLVEYPASLPPEYQHFHRLPGVGAADVERYAGSVVLADYCPYIQVRLLSLHTGEKMLPLHTNVRLISPASEHEIVWESHFCVSARAVFKMKTTMFQNLKSVFVRRSSIACLHQCLRKFHCEV